MAAQQGRATKTVKIVALTPNCGSLCFFVQRRWIDRQMVTHVTDTSVADAAAVRRFAKSQSLCCLNAQSALRFLRSRFFSVSEADTVAPGNYSSKYFAKGVAAFFAAVPLDVLAHLFAKSNFDESTTLRAAAALMA